MMKEGANIQIRVSIYSDYTCPWCYVGSARFERLKERLGDDVELVEKWMPFEIHPEVPSEGMSVDQLPYSKEQFREMIDYLGEQAAAEGLSISNLERVSNTHRALAAATFVQNTYPERFLDFHRRLFEAYFAEGRDLNDEVVLRRTAEEVGVPSDEMLAALTGGEYDDAIAATGEMARRLGISGTPTFVFENEFAVVGAHPVETLHSAVMKVVDTVKDGTTSAGSEA